MHREVVLADDRTVVADVVVSAVGLFGAARYPDIEGLADFSGHLMHTAHWDATVDLTGKRVAVVGTGASGVQVVPELAGTAARLTVFQRTPPWMVPKEDRACSVEELSRFRRRPWAPIRERWRLWKLQHDNTALPPGHPRLAVVQELSETFLRRNVADDRLRDALTPRYPFRCKRVLLGEKYYAALQYAHVDLVMDPIERIARTSCHGGWRRHRCRRDRAVDGVRDQQLPLQSGRCGHRRRKSARPLGSGPARLSRGRRQWVSELLHAVRPKHQPGRQLDHLHSGGRRSHGRQRRESPCATRRLPRRTPRCRTSVQPRDLRRSGANHMDSMRQLLPVADWAHRHAMAALGTRLRTRDVAATATRLASPRSDTELIAEVGLALIVTVTYYVGRQADCGGAVRISSARCGPAKASVLLVRLNRQWRVDSEWRHPARTTRR